MRTSKKKCCEIEGMYSEIHITFHISIVESHGFKIKDIILHCSGSLLHIWTIVIQHNIMLKNLHNLYGSEYYILLIIYYNHNMYTIISCVQFSVKKMIQQQQVCK